MELGTVLRRMRKRDGLSQEALSEKIHMSRSNISKLETNNLEIRARDLVAWARETNAQDMLIAVVLNVDISVAADVIANLTDAVNVGIILLGGFI